MLEKDRVFAQSILTYTFFQKTLILKRQNIGSSCKKFCTENFGSHSREWENIGNTNSWETMLGKTYTDPNPYSILSILKLKRPKFDP